MDINDNGIVDFSSIKYDQSLIKNRVKLSYDLAEKLIRNKDSESFLLTDRISTDLEKALRESLQQLFTVAKARKDFRLAYEKTSDDEPKRDSDILVEEMMLITSSALPHYKNELL